MAVVENRFVCDLSKPVQAQALKGNVFSLDNLGSRLSVLIYENGQPATISGSITANCILPDGSTVNVNGGLSTEGNGSKAYVDIPQSCLLIPGILKIAIKCTSSSVITTLAAIVANVYMTKTDNVITPSQQIINDWNAEVSAAIATQNASIANQDTKINDLKSAVKLVARGEASFGEFIQGKRAASDPETVTADSTRVTSSLVFELKKGDTIATSGTFTGLKYAIAGKASTNYDSGWKTDAFSYTVALDGIYFVNCAKTSGTITPSDVTFDIVITDQSSSGNKALKEIAELKDVLSEGTRNVIDLEDKESATIKNVTYSVNDNVLVSSGTSNDSNCDLSLQLKNPVTLNAGKYTFSFEKPISTNKTLTVFFLQSSGTYINAGSITNATQCFTYTASASVIITRIMIRIPTSGGYLTCNSAIQLESGEKATDYIPPISAKDSILRDKRSFGDYCNDYYVQTCVRKPIKLTTGKGLYIFGDSITTSTHGGFTWGSLIAEKTGCFVFNFGNGGATFNTSNENNNILYQVNNVSNWDYADVVIVAAGTNENLAGAIVASDLRGYVQGVITAIKTNAPNADIIFITPIKRAKFNQYMLPEIAGAICNVALENECSVINGADIPIVLTVDENEWIDNFDADDNLHPNATGKKAYAEAVLNAIGFNTENVDNTVEKITSGTRNFFDPKVVSKVTTNGITFSVDENGLIKISGTTSARTDIIIRTKESITLLEDRYSFEFDGTFSTTGSISYYFYNGSSYGTPVATSEKYGMYGFYSGSFAGIMLRIPSGRTVSIEAHLQIEKGKQHTAYIAPVVAKDSYARERINEKTWLKMVNTHYIGDCVIMKLPSGKVIMVDTQSNTDSIASVALGNALTEMGIYRVDHLIISHFHSDHTTGINILASAGVLDSKTTVYLPTGFDGDKVTAIEHSELTAECYANVMQKISTYGCQAVYPVDGQKVIVDNAEIEFFHCDHSAYWEDLTSYNDCSMCNYITIGSTVMMFTGDIDTKAIHNLEKSIRKCNILKVPHHCGKGAYNNLFMNSAYPEIALSSLGDGYTFNCTTEANANVFIKNENGFQKWFENHEVPNYIVGVMMDDIDMEIRPDGYRFLSNVRRCIRSDEGLVWPLST